MKQHFLLFISLCLLTSLQAQQPESLSIELSSNQYKKIRKHFEDEARDRNRNADWANFRHYAEANAIQEKPIKVVFMGNSITDGWAHQRSDFFADNDFAGRGISGQTTSQMLVRFQADVIDLKPKVVVILAGTNDLARNTGYIEHKHILQNIKSMCELAKVHKIKPVICSILPAHQYGWNKSIDAASEIKAMNELLKIYADKNKIPYVDYYKIMVDERGGLSVELAPDGVHPNRAGYEIMETEVLKTIRKYVKK